jgi:hypothetical protein
MANKMQKNFFLHRFVFRLCQEKSAVNRLVVNKIDQVSVLFHGHLA